METIKIVIEEWREEEEKSNENARAAWSQQAMLDLMTRDVKL